MPMGNVSGLEKYLFSQICTASLPKPRENSYRVRWLPKVATMGVTSDDGMLYATAADLSPTDAFGI